MKDTDVVVVGAGAVGLATAYAFALRGNSVVVIERASVIGSGISARNSEVVHAGLYYPAGSLKAKLCVEARKALKEFCITHGVTYDECGKLLVAQSFEEEEILAELHDQALANGVEGLDWLSETMARECEPELSCSLALRVAESAIFDSHAYMNALRVQIESRGGYVVTDTDFCGATTDGKSFRIRVDHDDVVTAEALIIAGGLGTHEAAAKVSDFPASRIPKLYFGKGDYFRLYGGAPFRHLIYPTPSKDTLGIHYRRDLGGHAIFGPDLYFVDEECYDVDAEKEYIFRESIARFFPGISALRLLPDYAGIRPKLHAPGEGDVDWRIETPDCHGIAGLAIAFGIESPGLTCSLGIGSLIADRIACSST